MSQEVPEVCFWGQSKPVLGSSVRPSIITPHFHEMHRCSPGASSASGYTHYELDRRLVDSSSVALVGSAASRCRPERVGDTPNHQKKCAFSTTEDHLPWHGMGLNIDSDALVSCEKNKARPVTHCDTFWTAVHETSTVVAQDQRVFPEGQPLSHDQVHALVMWKKPWFLSQGPVLGASCRHRMLTTDASLTGWGAILEGRSSQGLWKDQHLSWHINRLEMSESISCSQKFPSRSQGPPCAYPLRQHIGGVLLKSPGGVAVMSIFQTGVPNPPVVPREVVVSSSSLHPGGPQYRSRHPVETGAEA